MDKFIFVDDGKKKKDDAKNLRCNKIVVRC